MIEPNNLNKPMLEALFNNAAGSYNKIGPNIFTQFGGRLISHMSIKPGMNILDVATGTGAALLPAAKQIGQQGRITGIDLSGAMLKQTEHNAQAEGLQNTVFHKMDVEHLDFADRAFDAVTCAFAIFLFPDIKVALREIYRVCKSGGCLGVSVFQSAPELFAPAIGMFGKLCITHKIKIWQIAHKVEYIPDEIEALLKQAGFRSVKTIVEANDVVYTRAEDWWEFLLMGMLRRTIEDMDEGFRTRFKDEYFAQLRMAFKNDGLHIAMPVIYAVAER
jgi:O-methyltransferase / aklanonic acid methyltransferase